MNPDSVRSSIDATKSAVLDPTTVAMMKLLGAGALGWLVQWRLNAPKKIPTWVGWAAMLVGGAAIFIWVTPDFAVTQDNWRLVVFSMANFMLSVRGAASTSKDARIAPPTDSTGPAPKP